MVLNVIIRIVLIITNFTLTTLGYNLHRRNILFYVYVDCYWLCSLFNTSLFNFMYIWITRVVFNLYDIKLFWHNGFFLLIILNKKKWKGIIVWKYLLLINFFLVFVVPEFTFTTHFIMPHLNHDKLVWKLKAHFQIKN